MVDQKQELICRETQKKLAKLASACANSSLALVQAATAVKLLIHLINGTLSSFLSFL